MQGGSAPGHIESATRAYSKASLCTTSSNDDSALMTALLATCHGLKLGELMKREARKRAPRGSIVQVSSSKLCNLMSDPRDTAMRVAAFEHVSRLAEVDCA